ncbi:MAG: hypothetical protein AB7H97_11950 [Pseudobdellovibrionaceae bacterium]
MDLEILKKKISTFRGEGGRVRITDEALLMEILLAWEQWSGPIKGFYSAIGVSANGMASIIGKAKKLRREGHFPAEEFKELKLAEANVVPFPEGPCSGIEVNWSDGRFIRFYQVEQLIDFLKKVS